MSHSFAFVNVCVFVALLCVFVLNYLFTKLSYQVLLEYCNESVCLNVPGLIVSCYCLLCGYNIAVRVCLFVTFLYNCVRLR